MIFDFTHLFSSPAKFETSSVLVPSAMLALRSSIQSSSSSSGTRSGRGEQRDMSERLETEEMMLEVAVLLLEADFLLLLVEEDFGVTRLVFLGGAAVGVLSENALIAAERESSRPALDCATTLGFCCGRTGVSGKGVSCGNGIAGGNFATGITSLLKNYFKMEHSTLYSQFYS